MKQTRFIHPQKRRPTWTRNHWLLAVLVAFIVLIILGMVLFFFFPNRAV